MNCKISVIIPIYNVENYLGECLNSVINQTYKNIEIICVDDGSTDSSLEILNEYRLKDSRIKIISQQNTGQGYARYVGLKNSTGDFVFFMDGDDFLELNALSTLYENIRSNDSDMVIFKFIRYDHINNSKSYNNFGFDFDCFLDEDFNNFVFNYTKVKSYVLNASFAPWAKLYKREFLNRYDDFFFSKHVSFEDVLFHVQVMLRAKMSFCPEFLYNYRISNSNSSINSLNNNNVLDIFKMIDLVEGFLKDNGFYEEFDAYFRKFKFTQSIQYLLKSKSEKYFFKTKSELANLKLDFDIGLFDKILFDNLSNAYDFLDFYNGVYNDLITKINNLNEVINQKNSNVAEKEKIINLKENIIKENIQVINDKDELIKKELDELLKKENLIDEQEKIIQNKNELIQNNLNSIEYKNEIINNKNIVIENKDILIEEKNNIIRNNEDIIKEKTDLINNLINSISLKDDEIINMNDKLEKYVNNFESQTEELYKLKDNLRLKNSEFYFLTNENSSLNHEVLDLKNKIRNYEEKIESLNNKNNSLIKERDLMKGSNSWKMTKIFRKAGSFLRN